MLNSHKLIISLFILALGVLSAMHATAATLENVILLHGIIRSHYSMKPMQKALTKQNYQVLNINYPSTRYTIDGLVDYIHPQIVAFTKTHPGTINFVGHSMGALIIRAYIAKYHPQPLGKVVMLAPPNKGSEIADYLVDNKLYHWVFGPAGAQLTTRYQSQKLADETADYPIGIIAGNGKGHLLFSNKLPKPNDGTVSVASTQMPQQTDHTVVRSGHSFIMRKKQTIHQTIYFLQHGKFSHSADGT